MTVHPVARFLSRAPKKLPAAFFALVVAVPPSPRKASRARHTKLSLLEEFQAAIGESLIRCNSVKAGSFIVSVDVRKSEPSALSEGRWIHTY